MNINTLIAWPIPYDRGIDEFSGAYLEDRMESLAIQANALEERAVELDDGQHDEVVNDLYANSIRCWAEYRVCRQMLDESGF